MATAENIILNIEANDTAKFILDNFLDKLRQIRFEFRKLQQRTLAVGTALKKVFAQKFISPLLGSNKTDMTRLQNQGQIYKRLQADITSSMSGVSDSIRSKLIPPTRTAGMAVQSILDKQRDLATFSRQQKQIMETNGRAIVASQEAITKASRSAASRESSLQKLQSGGANKLLQQSEAINHLGRQYDSLGGVMRMPMERFQRFNKGMGEFNTLGGRFGNRMRIMTHGLRGFRMELLGVMFFGMAMKQFFGSMLRPAAQAVGFFEIFGQILLILFLPIMLELLPILLDFLDWFLEWPEAAKLALGAFVLIGLAIGTFLMLVGMIGLGIGSLFQLAGVGKVITAFTGALKAMGVFKLAKDFKNIFGASGPFVKGTLASGIKAAGKSLKNFLATASKSVVGKGILIAVGLTLLWKWLESSQSMLEDFKTSWNKRLKDMMLAVGAGGALGGVIFGGTGFGVGVVIALGVIILLNILDIKWERDRAIDKSLKKMKQDIEKATGETLNDIELPTTFGERILGLFGFGLFTKDPFEDAGYDIKSATDKVISSVGMASTSTKNSFNSMGLSAEDLARTFDISLTEANQMLASLGEYSNSFSQGFNENMESSGNAVETFAGKVLHATKKLIPFGRGLIGTDLPGGGSAFGGGPAYPAGFGGGNTADDFIWRAGQGITKINPNDNLVGTKGSSPMGGGINLTQNINVTASNRDEIDRLIQDNNSRLVDDLKRMTGA